MKKTLLSIALLVVSVLTSAQVPSLKAYSVYDIDKDNRVSIQDVTAIVSKLPKNKSIKRTVVESDSVFSMMVDLYFRLKDIDAAIANEPEPEPVDPHEYVDLGLPSGTLWAAWNIGAEKPEDYGIYFAWGETSRQMSNRYLWSSYRWMQAGKSSYKYVTKYTCEDNQTTASWYSDGVYVGSTIGDQVYKSYMVLDAVDDAATANWGEKWCLPTSEQVAELINPNYTTTEWTTVNNVNGRKVTSLKNGNSIFLPAAGFYSGGSCSYLGKNGIYWTKTLSSSYSECANTLFFGSSSCIKDVSDRCSGLSIRPVRAKK